MSTKDKEPDVENHETEQQEQTWQDNKQTAAPSSGEENENRLTLQALTEENTVGYVGVLFSAIVVLVALTRPFIKNQENYKYGLAVASVAMFLALCGAVMAHFKVGSDSMHTGLGGLLFVWVFVGACFMTFDSPFQFTGNGYFGSWGMVIFSLMNFGVSAQDAVKATKNMGGILGLFAASIILLTALISENFDDRKSYHAGMVYATILACLTIIVSGFFLYTQKSTGHTHAMQFYVMAAFMIMWIVAAGLVTFEGPFLITGNGYFAAWGGAVTSVFATMEAKPKANAEETSS